jgi:hypothetical protein
VLEEEFAAAQDLVAGAASHCRRHIVRVWCMRQSSAIVVTLSGRQSLPEEADMKIDMHFYTNGNDPFVFPLGDFLIHVHAGAPPHEYPTGPELDPQSELPSPAETPMMSVIFDPTTYPKPTPVPVPLGLVQVRGANEIQGWFDEVQFGLGDSPVRFRLDTVSGQSGPDIQSLLDGLQGCEREVSVDIVGWSEPGDG